MSRATVTLVRPRVTVTIAAAGDSGLAAHEAALDPHPQYLTEAAATAGYQPLDSDLTALAALATQAYGRSLLTSASASAARTTLGVVIGTDVQAYSANLAELAAVNPGSTGLGILALHDLIDASGLMLVSDGSESWGTTDATATGLAVLGAASQAAGRTALGLGTIATQAASSVAITGGTVTGITDLTVADGGTGASDASGARTNLGLVIGTNVQAYDAGLASLTGVDTAGDLLPYTSGANAWTSTSITAAGRALLDDADAAAQRTTLGITTRATRIVWQSGVQSAADTNSPSTLREWINATTRRQTADLTGCTQVRLAVQTSGTAGFAGSKISVQYSLNAGSTWVFLDGSADASAIGSATPQAPYDSALGSLHTSSWATLHAAARTEVLLRVVTSDGDGNVDPMLFYLWIEAR